MEFKYFTKERIFCSFYSLIKLINNTSFHQAPLLSGIHEIHKFQKISMVNPHTPIMSFWYSQVCMRSLITVNIYRSHKPFSMCKDAIGTSSKYSIILSSPIYKINIFIKPLFVPCQHAILLKILQSNSTT